MKKGRPPKKMKRPRQSAARQNAGPLALFSFVVNVTASFFRQFSRHISTWEKELNRRRQTLNPLKIKAFSVCHYYTVRAHLYNKPVGKWGATKRRAGTSWTFRCKYHNECIRPRYQRSEEKISEAAGYGSRAVKNLPLFRLVRAKTRAKHKD